MPTIRILGNSHSNRLLPHFAAFFQGTGIMRRVRLLGGATKDFVFSELDKIIVESKPEDTVICQALGNDVMRNIPSMRTRKYRGNFHLGAFTPLTDRELDELFILFYSKIRQIKGKVFIIDLPLRYIFCCHYHRYEGMVSYQRKVNRKLAQFAEQLPHVRVYRHDVLNHLTRLNLRQYASCFTDTVHLKPECYEIIADKIISGNWPELYY